MIKENKTKHIVFGTGAFFLLLFPFIPYLNLIVNFKLAILLIMALFSLIYKIKTFYYIIAFILLILLGIVCEIFGMRLLLDHLGNFFFALFFMALIS